jgi:hypothetical protein
VDSIREFIEWPGPTIAFFIMLGLLIWRHYRPLPQNPSAWRCTRWARNGVVVGLCLTFVFFVVLFYEHMSQGSNNTAFDAYLHLAHALSVTLAVWSGVAWLLSSVAFWIYRGWNRPSPRNDSAAKAVLKS